MEELLVSPAPAVRPKPPLFELRMPMLALPTRIAQPTSSAMEQAPRQEIRPKFPAQALFLRECVQKTNHSSLARASINSFGYGGSNAHAIVEQAKQRYHVSPYVSSDDDLSLDDDEAVRPSTKSGTPPRFTPRVKMGKDLLQFYPWTRLILEELNQVLQSLPSPPSWSLVDELTEFRLSKHLRQPEFSQPLVTALQLRLVAVLGVWGIKPRSVIGHSSSKIAAAYAAGLHDRAGAIIAAFYRGRAALNRNKEAAADVCMLARDCSGKNAALETLRENITAAGHFARRLQVDLAYHSELMVVMGQEYEKLLNSTDKFHPSTTVSNANIGWYSSVTQSKRATPADALYWKTNMVSSVRFDGALKSMLEDTEAPNFLIEIGPSGALAGPVSQVVKSLPNAVGGEVSYIASWSRGEDAGKSLFDVAGRLFVSGAPIDLAVVNQHNGQERTIVDLPNYSWNHSVKYWHENAASKDWRFRKYIVHDLLMDHRMGGNAIMPGAGFVTMALEMLYQKHCAVSCEEDVAGIAPNDLCWRFRNTKISRALVLEEGKDAIIISTLTKVPGGKEWHEFRISTLEGDVLSEHCSGLVRIQDAIDEPIEGENALALKSPQPPKL
ncbi:MAG: hypothetical protein Q9171_004622 [Xanthocarpia ochracea]